MKFIPGFENKYSITEDGKIWSHLTNKWMKFTLSKAGYLRITVYKDKIKVTYLVHRLVGITYIDNPDAKKEINHKNFIKIDNRIENLEWCSNKENITHSKNGGRIDLKNLFKKGKEHRFYGVTPKNAKPIIVVNNGRVFDSIKHAARELKLFHQNISIALKKNGSAGGLTFKYL